MKESTNKFETWLDKFDKKIFSKEFEKKMDKVTWWFLGFAFSYFIIRFLVSVLFGV